VLDFVLSIVGQLEAPSVQYKSQIQRSNIHMQDLETMQMVEEPSDVTDLLCLQGTIARSSPMSPKATLSFLSRRGQPYPDTPAFTWTINCAHGEIRITPATSPLFRLSEKDGLLKNQVHRFNTGQVKDVDWNGVICRKKYPLLEGMS
jgi:hypothetical protein